MEAPRDQSQFNKQLLNFLETSPTPFHAVNQITARLASAGFSYLPEGEHWKTVPGGHYFTTRNDSSVVAWTMPVHDRLAETGFRMVGAHTDSPSLKVKPCPDTHREGHLQLGVEVYGGALLNPWFDRDLSIAGRVNYLDGHKQIQKTLVDFRRPIAIVPSLAIHLDREANSKRTINAQTYLPPILGLSNADQPKKSFEGILQQELQASGAGDVQRILDYELLFYDAQPPNLLGLDSEFIVSARLDNLLSCFVGLVSLLKTKTEQGALLVCNDHEEVGSMSASGACGPMLRDTLDRLLPTAEERARTISHSFLVSADNAHALHPNFAEKHDPNHRPRINAGPVIKVNANQRYASNSETNAIIRTVAAEVGVPLQTFTVRTDMACGSTIGPLTSTVLGVRTIDIGLPQWAMHSIRETAGSADAFQLTQILDRFFQLDKL